MASCVEYLLLMPPTVKHTFHSEYLLLMPSTVNTPSTVKHTFHNEYLLLMPSTVNTPYTVKHTFHNETHIPQWNTPSTMNISYSCLPQWNTVLRPLPRNWKKGTKALTALPISIKKGKATFLGTMKPLRCTRKMGKGKEECGDQAGNRMAYINLLANFKWERC